LVNLENKFNFLPNSGGRKELRPGLNGNSIKGLVWWQKITWYLLGINYLGPKNIFPFHKFRITIIIVSKIPKKNDKLGLYRNFRYY